MIFSDVLPEKPADFKQPPWSSTVDFILLLAFPPCGGLALISENKAKAEPGDRINHPYFPLSSKVNLLLGRVLVFIDPVSPLEYFGIVLIGLLGTGHCVGMCGGFALMAGEGATNSRVLLFRHTFYQLGKASTYMFLALLLFLLGSAFQNASWFGTFQLTLAWIAGLIMILFGWSQISGQSMSLGLRLPRWLSGTKGCGLMLALFSRRNIGSIFLLGWLNGFIPCGLSFAVLLYLATLGSLEASLAGAFLFGMSTMPGLYLLARSRLFFHLDRRIWLVRATGCTVVLFGLLSVVRGTPPLQEWMGRNAYAKLDWQAPTALARFLPDLSSFGCCGNPGGDGTASETGISAPNPPNPQASGEDSCCAADPTTFSAVDSPAVFPLNQSHEPE